MGSSFKDIRNQKLGTRRHWAVFFFLLFARNDLRSAEVLTQELEWNCWEQKAEKSGRPILQVYRSGKGIEAHFVGKKHSKSEAFLEEVGQLDKYSKQVKLTTKSFEALVDLLETKKLLRSPTSEDEPVYLQGKLIRKEVRGLASEQTAVNTTESDAFESEYMISCWVKGEMPETVTDLENGPRDGAVSEI